MTEDDILKGLVTWLLWVKPKCLWWHTPNEAMSKVRRQIQKTKGVLPGVPDLIFMGMPYMLLAHVELKNEDGRMTPGQKDFKAFCDDNEHHEIPYHIIKTGDLNVAIDELQALLKEWGAL